MIDTIYIAISFAVGFGLGFLLIYLLNLFSRMWFYMRNPKVKAVRDLKHEYESNYYLFLDQYVDKAQFDMFFSSRYASEWDRKIIVQF